MQSGSVNANANVLPEKFVDIPITNLATQSSYSRGLVTLNIGAGSKSNESRITGFAPKNAKVTRVEVTGFVRTANVMGVGNANWYVRHDESDFTVSLRGGKGTVSTNDFAGRTANTTWTVWLEGASFSTVKGGSIRVYYVD